MGSAVNLSEIGTKITGDDVQFQRECVADLLNRQNINFPGAQPVSFARHHLQELQSVDYFICEKTDGVRCLLYLTQYVAEGGVPVEMQFLIDRKNDYYFIPGEALHVPRTKEDLGSFHTGTLLDGELVNQKIETRTGTITRKAYLIFDLLALDGENLMTRPFDKRYGRARELVYNPYRDFAKKYPTDIAAQPFNLQIKDMDAPYGTEMMFKDKIPNLPHGNDGLIFTCVTTPYVSGTDQHILKWKPPHENTIDFRLQIEDWPMIEDEDGSYEDWDAKPEISLQVNHGSGRYEYYATLNITDATWEKMKAMHQQFDGRVIECYRDPVSAQWRPKIEEDGTPRFRDDKTDGNHISVVKSVEESIRDAVSKKDLIDAAGNIRVAFKQRAAAAKQAKEEEQRRAAQARQQHQRPPQVKREAEVKREEDDGPKYED